MYVEREYKGILFLIDKEDEHYLDEHKWSIHTHVRKRGDLHYLRHKIPNSNNHVYFHRLIMGLPTANESDLCVDHINHDTHDNRKDNLRITTKKENSRNGRLRPNNKAGYTGVTHKPNSKNKKKYVAWICVNYKNIYLGCHTTAERAAHAYDLAAIKYFGEYAGLNFPDFDYASCNPDDFLSNEPLVSGNNKTGVAGVGYDKQASKWRLQLPIMVDGVRKKKDLGRFASLELAVEAKNKWIEEHGEIPWKGVTDGIRL